MTVYVLITQDSNSSLHDENIKVFDTREKAVEYALLRSKIHPIWSVYEKNVTT